MALLGWPSSPLLLLPLLPLLLPLLPLLPQPPPPLLLRRLSPFSVRACVCRELLRDPRVKFSGYKHPHPLDNDIIIRVQTSAGCPPAAAFINAANNLEQVGRSRGSGSRPFFGGEPSASASTCPRPFPLPPRLASAQEFRVIQAKFELEIRRLREEAAGFE